MTSHPASIYQNDARLFHQPQMTYECVTEVHHATLTPNTVTFTVSLTSGKQAYLSVQSYAGGIIRIRLWQGTPTLDDESTMLAMPHQHGKFHISESAHAYSLQTASGTVYIRKAPFDLRLINPDGQTIFELEHEQIAGQYVTPPLGFRQRDGYHEPFLSWRIRNRDRFFGLGEKWNKVEKTGTRATIWSSDTCGTNTTDMSYKSVPVLFCTAGWGMMLHTSWRSFWEVGHFSYTSGAVLSESPTLDLFFFLAADVKGLIERYTALTGRPSMPPVWAFGVWMSRCAYKNRDEVEAVLDRLRAEKIPCDVIHIDPLWMKTHYYPALNVDACDFDWNEQAWPDRESMMAQWREQGFSTSLWINPYIPEGTALYEQASAAGFLVKDADGNVARLAGGQAVGAVDFSNPAAVEWWKDLLRDQVRDGVAVFKPDYGDAIAEHAVFHNGRDGREMHNQYLFLYTRAAAEVIQEMHGHTITWRRAGYIGSQRYPATWAGDTQVSWEAMRCCLRGGLSAGLTGESFWSHDIGGFVGPKPDPELYIRWAQWGLLSPFSRFHGNTPREPWFFGEEAVEVVRHYAQLRYRLVPYLQRCAIETITHGLPILRHMALAFPDEAGTEYIDDQYLLGADLLVAPIFDAGQRERMVYFPAGEWRSIDDRAQVYRGSGYRRVSAPLERIPVFMRVGSQIPAFAHAPMHLKGELPPIVDFNGD